MHIAFITLVARYQCTNQNYHKCYVKQYNRPFLFVDQFIMEYASNEIDAQQEQ